jgi:mannosyl-3-phosphoglycerate phosphatase
MSILVFTDLDGSLMEHETYSIEPARPVLQTLQSREIPVVINSSKTAKEIHAVQKQLGLDEAFVCENGALLSLPKSNEIREFGQARETWLEAVHHLRAQEKYLFTGFYDWSVREISELTGLSQEQATLSKIRQYSEPILWRDSVGARAKFEQQIAQLGLRLLEGGRFLSIQSHFDKSNAMNWMIQQQPAPPTSDPLITVALGDSPNDEAMLNSADIAVVIKSAKSERISINGPNKVIKTKRPGPAGWQDAMTEILNLYDSGLLKGMGNHSAP